MRELHIFDMDGTLVDTKEAVLWAYRRAADELKVPLPENLWGISAREWACPPALHELKRLYYTEAVIRFGIKEAWAAPRFRELYKNNVPLSVWTGASKEAVDLLRSLPELADLLPEHAVACGLSLKNKISALRFWAMSHESTNLHYYDDLEVVTNTIRQQHIRNVTLHTPKGVLACA